MCRLRGILYLRMDSLHLAKESYMESLALDVRNFDVFLELTNSFMTPEEGTLNSLIKHVAACYS
jgi:anaphase-promoting complex subunit 6